MNSLPTICDLPGSTPELMHPEAAGTDRRALTTARCRAREHALHWADWGARLALAGLFLWAGAKKAQAPELFLQDIESFQLLPYRWAWLTSIWLPFLEITAALALLTTRRWAQTGALVLGGLLIAFVVAIGSAWARGLSLSCGCFGDSTEAVNYPWLLTRDVLMLGLAAFIVVTAEMTKAPKR